MPKKKRSDQTSSKPTVWILLATGDSVRSTPLREQLEAAGFGVAEMRPGARCARAALEMHFDVVLMDIATAPIDCLTAANQIRDRESRSPVIPTPLMMVLRPEDKHLGSACHAQEIEEIFTLGDTIEDLEALLHRVRVLTGIRELSIA